MPYGDRLFELLGQLERRDLERIWTESLARKVSDQEYKNRPGPSQVECVSRELRSVAGHSVLNIFRAEHGLAWRDILVFVLTALTPIKEQLGSGTLKIGEAAVRERTAALSEPELETMVLKSADDLVRRRWDAMSPEQRERIARQVAADLEQQMKAAEDALGGARLNVDVTASTLGGAIASGLIAGGGASMLLAGGVAFSVLGALGVGFLTQLGLALVVSTMGWIAGVHALMGGWLGIVGAGVFGIPFAVAGVIQWLASPSTKKTLAAVLDLLTTLEIRRQAEARRNEKDATPGNEDRKLGEQKSR